MSKDTRKPADPPPSFVPVCAIGASAGGVGALQTLFRLLPDDLDLAYVVIVHLSPDYPSAMHEILAACNRMPVHQVKDGPTLKANCVYVIAPDSELVIEGDNIQARPFTDPRGKRAPIDMFFRSVAVGRGDGIAVVLTGAGADGALGVRAIKEAGGIVMVQEPAEAGFPSMPENAIATGVADVVAPLARLAERIADATRSKEAVRSLDEDGAANDIRRIVAFLRTRTGHDFSGYKRSTVLRRIQRRMQVAQITSLADYATYLRVTPEEAKELLSDMLISVTMFFRDPETFITLNHRVIRPLMESRSAGDTEGEIRAWVVGCATGEEAYSLAILLLEEADRLKVHIPIQIFATDLDEGALATAREGRYPRSIEADVSAERLKRFFVDEGTHYRIDRQVRDLILFAAHSVVREPPFTRLDLITCRNVLIYLERSLQNQVSSIFRYGLKPDGYLFLGTAEAADTSDNHFAVVDRDARIYRALPSRPDFVPALSAPPPWNAGRPALTESRLATARFDAGEVLGESHAAALEASAPPSALVDAEQGVLHLSPNAGRFMLLSAGPLSGRLPSIVRPELRIDLKLALDRAFDTHEPSITRPITVVIEGAPRKVSLNVAPLPPAEGTGARAVVYFIDSGPGHSDGAEASAPPPDELQHLHSELKVAQEAELAGRLRHESVVQELRASNEELQSLNEEYRSTAEELETSKEELQSINEELQTVNAELKSKLGIISAAHNDLKNLTASSEIGTLFLDLELRIRMFTPRVAELFNIAEADVGRPITNFTHRLDYDGIASDMRRVLRELTPIETEVRTVDGFWFLIRIRPYRTIEGKVEGAVATFDDITERKESQEALAEELRNTAILQRLGARLVTVENIQTIYEDILTAAMEITRAKAGTVQMFDAEAEELVVLATRGFSKRTEEYFHRLDLRSNTSCGFALRNGERSYVNFDPASTETSTRLHVEDGVLSAQSSILRSRSGKPIGMVSTHWGEPDHRPSDRELRFLDLLIRQAADLIEQRQAEAALHESLERFQALATTAGNTIYHVSADWRVMYQVDSDTLAPTSQSMGNWVERCIPAEDLPAVRAAIAEAVRTRSMFELEHRVLQADGSIGWVLSRAVPLLDADGQIAEWFGAVSDVTDRQRAVEKLRESEEKYRSVFEGIDEGFCVAELVHDASGKATDYRLVEVNPAFERQTGLTNAEGRLDSEIAGTEQRWLDIYAEVARTGEGRRIEDYHEATKRWYDVHISRLGEGAGSRLSLVFTDITERKAAEAALRQSEERLRGVLDSMAEGFALLGPDFTILDVNAATLRMDGRSREDLVGRTHWEAFPGTENSALGDLYRRTMRERVSGSVEFRYLWPDGRDMWVHVGAHPTADGRIAAFWRDITDSKAAADALRASEQWQQTLLEGVPQLVWRAVDNGHWTWASPQWTEYTGQSERDSHGWGWLGRVHPDDREAVKLAWSAASDGGEFRADYRIRQAHGGRCRWFQTRATPVRDDRGEVVEWLGTSTDVDDLRQLQERQQVLVAELQYRTFNLMGVVRSIADATIRSSATLDDFKTAFRDRIAALARVQRLLSRVADDDRVTFDELIRAELEAVGALQGDGRPVLLDGPQGVALRSSTVQTFAMALHELTTNAIKYGALKQPDARLAVRWWVEAAEDGQPWLHMDWRETGVSMPPADAKPRGTGQGRTLIERALPYQLNARTSYVMTAEGVHCSIALPASTRTTAERNHASS